MRNREFSAKLVAGLFLLFVLMALSGWVYEDVKSLKKHVADDRVTIDRTGEEPRVHLDQLLEANLFGQKLLAESHRKARQKAPETRLKLELKGVFSNSNPSASSALIAEKNRPAKYYRVGEQLPGDARLTAVTVDYVNLKRNGIEEVLSFNPAGTEFSRQPDQVGALPQEEGEGDTMPNVVAHSPKHSDSLRERLRQLRDVQSDAERQEPDD